MTLYKRIFAKCICLSTIVFLLFISKSACGQSFLRANGKSITDAKGNKVILRGMGLGGWMLQEGYMLKLGNVGQQYKIKQKIADVAGDVYAELFYDNWLANNTSKVDIDSLASWGFNSIRLPMHYQLYTLPVDKEPIAGQNTWIEKGFALTDSLLNWCKAKHMYLILDLHATPGGQGNDLAISDREPSKPSLWESEANQQKMIALWRKLAERYRNEPAVAGYDIINEPNWGFENAADKRGTAEIKNEPLKKLMTNITKAIREVDKNHIIIIEGNGFGNNYRGIFPLWDNNIVLSFHKYGNFNTKATIQSFLDLREQNNVPIWLGESGENSNTWFTDEIRLMESYDIGWCWWQLKKIGINNPLEIRPLPSYQKLLDYWNGKVSKPDQKEAISALNEFLNSIKIENNIFHKDVVDAMFRQVKSNTSVPFKKVLVDNDATINAVDYDLGAQRTAYFDKDTASYRFTPGVNTKGNRGGTYRNDGVDIEPDSLGYHIFSIENGEWLQYTFRVKNKANYTVQFLVSSENGKGKITLSATSGQQYSVPLVKNNIVNGWYTVEVSGFQLPAGENKVKVYCDEGGFKLKSIRFIKN